MSEWNEGEGGVYRQPVDVRRQVLHIAAFYSVLSQPQPDPGTYLRATPRYLPEEEVDLTPYRRAPHHAALLGTPAPATFLRQQRTRHVEPEPGHVQYVWRPHYAGLLGAAPPGPEPDPGDYLRPHRGRHLEPELDQTPFLWRPHYAGQLGLPPPPFDPGALAAPKFRVQHHHPDYQFGTAVHRKLSDLASFGLFPAAPPAVEFHVAIDLRGNTLLKARYPIAAYSGNTTLDEDDHFAPVDASGGAVTITLPLAADNSGKTYHIKKTDSSVNAVTIDGNGSETIDGATTADINTQYESVTVQCDGTEWHIR